MTDIPGLKASLDVLNTGDLLLFGDSPFWFGRVVSYFSKSKYSHIGVVLKDPTYIDPKLKGIYLLESGEEEFADSEDGLKKFGVQITSITELLSESSDQLGYLTYRRLHTSMPVEELEKRIKAIHDKVHGKPYDVDLFDFLEASSNINVVEKKSKSWLTWLMPNHRKTDTYFCSALAGRIYTYLGFLPEDTNWSECTPQFFSSIENPSMKLVEGNYLDPDTLIYQNPNLKNI